MKAFLTMKHWQLFLLIFALPLIGAFAMLVLIVINPGFIWMLSGIVIINMITYALLIAWQYSLVHNLNKLLPDGVTLNMTLFKICLTVLLFIIVITYYFLYHFISMEFSQPVVEPMFDFQWLLGLVFLSMMSMAASLYVLYTMSKALVAVEKQRNVQFGDFVVEFILFWFWVVGIWFMQPRINAIFNDPGDMQSSPVIPPPIPG